MSEPAPAPADFSEESTLKEDATIPTAEILNVLEQLKESQETEKAESQEQALDPPSEWDLLRQQLADKPHDPAAWRKLVEMAENSGDLDKINDAYESLLAAYPNTSAAQIAYINRLLTAGSIQHVKTLFNRYLRFSPFVDLWKYYLTTIRRGNNTSEARDELRHAYEYALNHIGQDKDSGEIWHEYIQFLKAGECANTWEEQQKMDALRKAYHRAVQIPLDNVERLWQDYEAFETGLNRITAKKFMADLSPAHMQARTVLRQLQKHLGPLFPPLPPSNSPRPPLFLPALPTFNPPERALVGAWKAYLKWEEGNPLEIEDKDKSTLIIRIQGVYRKALVRMRFYGEIWYMAYVWTNSVGKQDEALNILKMGIEANPTSFLLNFAYAEQLEARKDFPEVHATFEKFLSVLRADLEEREKRIQSASSSFSSNLSSNLSGPTSSTMSTSVTTEAGVHSNSSSFATQASDEKPAKNKELAERQSEYSLVWIMYMRFGRRVEGLQSMRGLFGKARRDRWIKWEVYEAAALSEYHCTKDTSVASRIFEKGLETYGEEIDFVLRYLGFLISVNDENNARALFERVITTFPPERGRPLWERWSRYEYQYGDLEAAQKLEKRIAEAYKSDPPIKLFAQRHTYLGTDAIAARDLGFAMARHSAGSNGSSSSLGRTESQLSLLGLTTQTTPAPTASNKRPSSPDYSRKREDSRTTSEYGPPAHKRPRPMSPPRERERERWDVPPPRRRFAPSPQPWERERDRDGPPPPPPPPRRVERDREEEKTATIPSVISWFIGQLPMPSVFDGPVFRTDDLMLLLRNAVIPSSSGGGGGVGSRLRSPPPPVGPARGSRPPPDYGPYQGPGGSRGGRRY